MHVFDEALVADPYCLTRIRSAYELTKERDASFDTHLESHVAIVDQKRGRGRSDRNRRPRSTGRCRVPDEPLDEYATHGPHRLPARACACWTTEQTDGRERRHNGLQIVVVACHRAGRKTVGSHETPGESLDDLGRGPAMPRQRLEPGCSPGRRREALQQPVARWTRTDVSGVVVDERNIGAAEQLGKDVDAESNPPKERRGIGHTAGAGLSRRAGLVLTRSANARAIGWCRRISPSLRTIDGGGSDVMVADEDIDASRNSGRGELLRRPRHDPRHGLSEAPVAECDQSRADVIPTPAGEVDPKDPSRVVEHGHQDNVVSDWSALGANPARAHVTSSRAVVGGILAS